MRLIDADALKKIVKGRRKAAITLTGVDMVMLIDDAPTIEAEPVKHGRWIEAENDLRISGYCSSCGWEAHMYEDDVIGMPYCPNCGARMDGGEE